MNTIMPREGIDGARTGLRESEERTCLVGGFERFCYTAKYVFSKNTSLRINIKREPMYVWSRLKHVALIDVPIHVVLDKIHAVDTVPTIFTIK